eukprot:CAMPEP_0173241506 /NCGR_PEP_ID=MMETSP1142-20121109/14418_1 /TAXON_ID=483371 /ORGANISM="non described non described, Strain CCMP2298" /LENGTH=123 /DNA_ID=CAMNT_0014172863 /DNA_START=406 /DNA_END=774 /DNA_ORIENTATION=+
MTTAPTPTSTLWLMQKLTAARAPCDRVWPAPCRNRDSGMLSWTDNPSRSKSFSTPLRSGVTPSGCTSTIMGRVIRDSGMLSWTDNPSRSKSFSTPLRSGVTPSGCTSTIMGRVIRDSGMLSWT